MGVRSAWRAVLARSTSFSRTGSRATSVETTRADCALISSADCRLGPPDPMDVALMLSLSLSPRSLGSRARERGRAPACWTAYCCRSALPRPTLIRFPQCPGDWPRPPLSRRCRGPISRPRRAANHDRLCGFERSLFDAPGAAALRLRSPSRRAGSGKLLSAPSSEGYSCPSIVPAAGKRRPRRDPMMPAGLGVRASVGPRGFGLDRDLEEGRNATGP